MDNHGRSPLSPVPSRNIHKGRPKRGGKKTQNLVKPAALPYMLRTIKQRKGDHERKKHTHGPAICSPPCQFSTSKTETRKKLGPAICFPPLNSTSKTEKLKTSARKFVSPLNPTSKTEKRRKNGPASNFPPLPIPRQKRKTKQNRTMSQAGN